MTDDPGRARRTARVALAVGAALFWGLTALLVLRVEFALLDALLTAGLLTLVPALSLAQVPLARDVTIDRVPAYWSSIVTLWLLGTSCFLVGTRASGPAAIGLTPIPPVPLVGWSIVLTLAGLAIILAARAVSAGLQLKETPLLRGLLPTTGRERRIFALLSLAAGTGEEIAYRGYLIPILAPATGLWGAALLSTAVFGVMHAYQGPLGIVRTFVMGGVLAAGFLASGSLLPAMIAHTAIDVIAGIFIGEWLLSHEEASGVQPDAPDPA